MSFFGYLFGSSSDKYSREPRALPEQTLYGLVSRTAVPSIDRREEPIIEKALKDARDSSGMISLYRIDQVLGSLVSRRKITPPDKAGLMKIFVRHFEKKKK